MERIIIETEDGSSTLKLLQFDEQYHSIHGALNESMHIFIHSGLEKIDTNPIHILEVGFGTGLNALLTYYYHHNRKIKYCGIEAYPLTDEEIDKLNYVQQINPDLKEVFHQLHHCQNNETIDITNEFSFTKKIMKVENYAFEKDYYDLVYYDAFSPNTQPELWNVELFEKIYYGMKKGGILITYCAKGSVKRAMKSAGFDVIGLPGPIGKREITQCIKK